MSCKCVLILGSRILIRQTNIIKNLFCLSICKLIEFEKLRYKGEMIRAQQKNYLELVQNTFSTIILYAVQYFPDNVKKIHSELSGCYLAWIKGNM
ncbi:hypothetical protein CN481_15735 [Bacillus sp. AFS006103]|nr:hypothetical protein CN481_15735 [Bacillus sp. AFS006103]